MQIAAAGPSVMVPSVRPWRHAVGLLYVVGSVGLSFYSLSLFVPYLQNDLFWRGFATLNTSAALRYVYNRALISFNATSRVLDVEALPWSDPYLVLPTYGRQLLYQHMTALPTAIASLRRLDSSLFTFLPTKYCWLDLERRWEMGVTTATQARCVANDRANGAAYLEAVLRNMDFEAWYAQNGQRFDMRVLTPLNASAAGSAWSTRLFAHTFLDVPSEVRLWEAHGIASFQLLYSNHYEVGVLETIAVENALGVVSSFTIKSIASVQRGTPSWTTALLTGNFEFELQGPGVNQSLVRHTPRFYGDIDPTQVQVYLLGPFRGPINDVVHAQIGMLNNLRLRWVPPPPDLIGAVQSFDALVLAALQSNAAFARAYNAVPASMELPPPLWTDAPTVYFGGNPMCAKQLPLHFTWTRQSSLFVVANGVNTSRLCSIDACTAYLASVAAAAELLGTISAALPASVIDSDVGLMQFAAPASNDSDISLQTQRLFAPMWRPHGVACAYDWVQNVREVVSFEGDVRSLQLMSAAYTGASTTFAPPRVSLGSYLLAMTAVVTGVLCLVAAAIVSWAPAR
ncbi:hypothetical protein SPRG_11697 [Saprolegnia parasitica CBS 223.65]|uniref:Uncharacterized protein n=1 Tax=Saprolegnia parasitica (strain CBS 223.65) TaxID=695850 RepID=A0A067BW51_SAPPC|nr:hypothetical protein SPRG_11697 [Saprolegnia parasitica CBS 223.65]KDO22513.1 hypothetical protein SPRG_11697 [Saprolegnia parasitica CBS 223.65]|eukprot:XP_012206761.1 hypothetical protein SPRG_11697 [Saprolegnia parasitica CBS 223.65]